MKRPDFLARDPGTRSNTSVCLVVIDPDVRALDAKAQAAFAKSLSDMLEAEAVAFDIASYRDAPPGLRIWCGGTVETANLAAMIAHDMGDPENSFAGGATGEAMLPSTSVLAVVTYCGRPCGPRMNSP